MKIKLNKKKFENSLNTISKALNINSPLNSLQGILISVTGNCIYLIASNGNLSIKKIINIGEGIEIIEPGKILVPGKLFRDVIKKQENEITITLLENSIEITSDGSKTALNLLNVNDYPTINFDVFGKELIISSTALKNIIKNVSFAASDLDKRIILNGVNLQASNHSLIASATNSFRLASEKVNIENGVEFNITILSKNLKDFLPSNATGDITISVNDSKIVTKYNNTIIASKLIDGVYPQIEKLIPQSFEKLLTIEAKEISNLVEKAIVISNDGSKVIKLSIIDQELIIESKRDEVASTVIKSTNFKFTGQNFSIPFNALFFKEAISKFSGTIKIAFCGEQEPFVIKGASSPSLTQLILPHRTY